MQDNLEGRQDVKLQRTIAAVADKVRERDQKRKTAEIQTARMEGTEVAPRQTLVKRKQTIYAAVRRAAEDAKAKEAVERALTEIRVGQKDEQVLNQLNEIARQNNLAESDAEARETLERLLSGYQTKLADEVGERPRDNT